MTPQAYVLEAALELDRGADPALVGAVVTTALCGHWEHEGPCRWPHNNAVDAVRRPAVFRTLFVAEPGEEAEVRQRIDTALRGAAEWRVERVEARAVDDSERELAERLRGSPREDR